MQLTEFPQAEVLVLLDIGTMKVYMMLGWMFSWLIPSDFNGVASIFFASYGYGL